MNWSVCSTLSGGSPTPLAFARSKTSSTALTSRDLGWRRLRNTPIGAWVIEPRPLSGAKKRNFRHSATPISSAISTVSLVQRLGHGLDRNGSAAWTLPDREGRVDAYVTDHARSLDEADDAAGTSQDNARETRTWTGRRPPPPRSVARTRRCPDRQVAPRRQRGKRAATTLSPPRQRRLHPPPRHSRRRAHRHVRPREGCGGGGPWS